MADILTNVINEHFSEKRTLDEEIEFARRLDSNEYGMKDDLIDAAWKDNFTRLAIKEWYENQYGMELNKGRDFKNPIVLYNIARIYGGYYKDNEFSSDVLKLKGDISDEAYISIDSPSSNTLSSVSTANTTKSSYIKGADGYWGDANATPSNMALLISQNDKRAAKAKAVAEAAKAKEQTKQNNSVETPPTDNAETKGNEIQPKQTKKTIYEKGVWNPDADYNEKQKENAIKQAQELLSSNLKDEQEKIKYSKKISLNVYPISKLNVSNNIDETAWQNRLNYVLGDSSSMLYKVFANDKGLVFPYTPSIKFGYKANYEKTEITHSNLSINQYKNTPPPSINITADFTADGEDNARYMYCAMHFLRAMTKCEFGINKERSKYAGLPPPVLYLNGWENMINNIPVVVTSFDVDLPKDKHYVYLSDYGVWLPTEMTFQIGLEIQPNLFAYKNFFDLDQYKKDVMLNVKNTKKISQLINYEGRENRNDTEITYVFDENGKEKSKTSKSITQTRSTYESADTNINIGHAGMGWTW